MKTNRIRFRLQRCVRISSGLALFACVPAWLAAQDSVESSDDEDIFELSPFQVEADEGYIATSSLAGSRLNRPLSETSASLSVMTRDFLDDTVATDIVEAIDYSVSTRAYTPAGELPGGNIQSAIFSPTTLTTRGFASEVTRNYFRWEMFSDNYNAERLEMSRGPNSILFATGGVGGIVNVGTKKAQLGGESANFYETSVQVGSWDRYRFTFDANRVITDNFAIRVNGVYHEADSWINYKFDERKGIHLAATWEAIDTEQFGLRVLFEAEDLSQTAGNGRSMPLNDQVLGGWDGVTGVGANGNITGIPGLTRMGNSNAWVWIPEDGVLMDFRRQPITQGAPNTYHFINDEVAPRGTNFRLGEGIWVDARNYTLQLQGQAGRDFFAEVAFNRQDQYFENLELRTTEIFRDPNLFLPDGSTNPHFGEYFSQTNGGQMLNRPRDTVTDEYRITASYNLRLDDLTGWEFLGNHWFAGLISDRSSEEYGNTLKFYAWNDATGQRLQRALIRRYLSDPDAGVITPETEISSGGVTARWVYESNSQRSYEEDTLESQQLVYMGKLWGDRISLTYGLRWDSLSSQSLPNSSKELSADGRTITFTNMDLEEPTIHFDDEKSESYGGVFRPFKPIAFTYNYSESFAPEGRFKIDFNHPDPYWDQEESQIPVGPETGNTKDYGIRFFLNEERIQGSVVWFETSLNNDFINLGGTWKSAMSPIFQLVRNDPTYSFGLPSTNGTFGSNSEGIEFELTANLNKRTRLRATYSKYDTVEFDIAPQITIPMETIYLPRWNSYVAGWQLGPGETLPEGVTQPSNPVNVPALGRPLTFAEAHGGAVDPNYVRRSEEAVLPTGAPGLHDYINQALLGMDEKSYNRENLPALENRPWTGNLMIHHQIADTDSFLDRMSVRYGARVSSGYILNAYFDSNGQPVIVQDSGVNWVSDLGFRYRQEFEKFDLTLDLFVKNLFDDNLVEPLRDNAKYTYNDERNFLFTATARF